MKLLSTLFRANILLVAAVFLGLVLFSGCGDDTTQIIQTQPNITEIATEAYIYGYVPIQVMASTYNQTNSTADPVYAPINKLYIDTQTSTIG